MLCKLSRACSFTLQRCRFPQLLKRTGPRGTEGRQRSERGLNMFTKTFTLAAALSLALIFPASSLARNTVYTYWYQPHYMAKVDDAYNSLQFMSPHFVPGNQYAMPNPPTTTFTLEKVTQSTLGLNLFFTESGVEQKSPGLLSLNTVTVPYKKDVLISIVYADIRSSRYGIL